MSRRGGATCRYVNCGGWSAALGCVGSGWGNAVKIPFERTIASAYSFAFRNILSILGIAWFPYLLLTAIGAAFFYVFGRQFFDFFTALPAKGHADPATILRVMRPFFLAYAILLPAIVLVSAMVSVGVLRKALGLHPGPVFVFFSLARRSGA